MESKNAPIFTLTTEQFSDLVLGIIKKAGISSPTSSDNIELLSLSDVMKYFKKSRSTIFSWKRQGLIRGTYVSGSLFFLRSELENVIKSKNK